MIQYMKYIMWIWHVWEVYECIDLDNYCYGELSWMQEQVQASERKGKYHLGEELGLVTSNSVLLSIHTLMP